MADVKTLLGGKNSAARTILTCGGVGSGADFERYVKAQHAKEQLQERYNAKASEVASLKAGVGIGAGTQGGEYNEAVETTDKLPQRQASSHRSKRCRCIACDRR